jgi:hypothetical protein
MKFGVEFKPQRTGRRTLLQILTAVLGLTGAACFIVGQVEADTDHRYRMFSLGGIVLGMISFVIRSKVRRKTPWEPQAAKIR